jgi:hypothetical protein
MQVKGSALASSCSIAAEYWQNSCRIKPEAHKALLLVAPGRLRYLRMILFRTAIRENRFRRIRLGVAGMPAFLK